MYGVCQRAGAAKGVAEPFGRTGANPAGRLAEQGDSVGAGPHLGRRERSQDKRALARDGPAESEAVFPQPSLQQVESLQRFGPGTQGRTDDQVTVLRDRPAVVVRDFGIDTDEK